jgi:hypothetical protein
VLLDGVAHDLAQRLSSRPFPARPPCTFSIGVKGRIGRYPQTPKRGLVGRPARARPFVKTHDPLSPFGLMFGAAAFVAALTPSMLPRPGVTRGRVRSCLRDPLPATSKFEEALKLARFSEVALDPLE